ncbi:MAG: HK97 family phage prohead protease [Rickettsiales bacterium]|nr:HK97 family phage prohead protease [Rickettsiales bacterium]
MKNFSKDYTLEIKSISKLGVFTGYASVYNIIDNHDDVILPFAFSDSLMRENNIKLLWQHRADEPIGIITHIEEDEMGLFVEGKLLLEVERAREAYALLKSGVLRGLSIGFRVTDFEINESNIRLIKSADLFEISLVTFPANESAKITSVKSNEEELELLALLNKAIRVLRG